MSNEEMEAHALKIIEIIEALNDITRNFEMIKITNGGFSLTGEIALAKIPR